MATLNIEGRKVTVDDSFLKLSPEEQHATVDQIASSLSQPDKYQQAALDEQAAKDAAGDTAKGGDARRAIGGILSNYIPASIGLAANAINTATNGRASDLARLGQQGASFNAMDEIYAGLETPLEMYRRGTLNPAEAYKYAKAREDLEVARARANTGYAGTAAELLGGAMTGGGLAKSGLTTARWLSSAAPGLLGRTATSAADAALLSGVAGFNEGNGLSDRLSKAGEGAFTGGLIGGALPVGLAAARGAVSPFLSNIIAQVDPHGYGRRQVARAIAESGMSTDEIGRALQQAQAEGQGNFTVADALGNSGQRMLSSVARAPGEGRTNVVNYLENRQAGQGRRVANALSEGFEAPETGAQVERRLTEARNDAADTEFGAVREDANPVDVVPAIDHIDSIIGTQPGQQLQTPNDSVESVLRGFRERLARVNPDDFSAVQRIRGDMADAAQNARQQGYGNRARLIGGAVRQLDTAMENASEGFLQANRNFAQASRDIEAVQAGREAATRGRSEDVIPAYQGLRPEAQAAFRSGYVDPLIAQTQGSALGVNKARPFANDAFASEAEAMAPGNDLMQRRLGREMRMFETRNTALGGSKTADNLADAEALGVDPSVVGHILHGNYAAAARHLIASGSNAVTGNTAAVRSAVANLLLRNGSNISPAQLDQLVGETVRRIQFVQELSRGAKSAGLGALAVTPNATHKQSRPPYFAR